MRTDRRGFLRVLAGAVASFSAGAAAGPARDGVLEIHRATRNTLIGPVGPRQPRLRSAPAPFKPYPGQRRLALPRPRLEPRRALAESLERYAPDARFREAPLSLEALSRLLQLTNGVTGRRSTGDQTVLLRAAPSAGALYAGEVYVVAERVRGLPAGIYYYAVQRHELVQLRVGASLAAVGQALERPAELEHAAAVILLSNVFARYTWRYANRGYRYALIDTGHIGENLRLAAVSAGLSERAPLRFQDDRLDALLGIDGRAEAVCALHAVGRPDPTPGRPPPVLRRFVEKQSVAPPSGGRLEIERYHEATRLVPGESSPERPAHAAQPPARAPSPAARAENGPTPATAVVDSIRRRRSALRFEPEALGRAELDFVLGAAGGHAVLRRVPGVALQLVVHRVEGLEPGLYRYVAGIDGPRLVRPGDLVRPLVRACVGQEKAGTAAVAVLMVGSLANAGAQRGDRGYRELLVEAGAIAQRVYLAAEASGLAARNLAAFRDDELDALVGLDGRREAVIHLTLLGHGD